MADLFSETSESLELDSSSLFLERFSRPSTCRPLQTPPSVKLLSEGSPLPPFPSNFPNSKRIPGTRFVVDGFRHAGAFSVSYFLSQFHADHYVGLSPNWSRGLVFCSPITARLCISCLHVPKCFLVAIDIGHPILVDGCEVAFVDANHCPGAVQILIKVGGSARLEGRYVHTGDMRFSRSMLNDRLLNAFVGADAVFLDTTYCNPRFVFPSQEESIEYVVKSIERIRNRFAKDSDAEGKNNSVLFVLSTYVIGKEKLLLGISRGIGCSILVDSRKMMILEELGMGGSQNFTTDASQSDVHVVGWNELGETWPYFRPNFLNMKKILDERKKYSRVVGFVPTGWVFSKQRDDFVVRVKDSCEIHLVPYSEHSSYDELRQYVKFLRPKSVVPTVGVENGKKTDDEYRRGICKHFSGLMDEMANKLCFLEAFRSNVSSLRGPQKPDASLNDENSVLGVTSKEDREHSLENQKSETESTCCELRQDSVPETVQFFQNNDSQEVSANREGDVCSPSEAELGAVPLDDEMDVNANIQELQDCLPAWVTTGQMTNLLKDSGGDIIEAVSLFYECDRELHEQAVSQGKTISMQTPGSQAVDVQVENSIPVSDSSPTFGKGVISCKPSDGMPGVSRKRSLSQTRKPPLPKPSGPRKKGTVGTNSSKKKAKSLENPKPDKLKQVTIMKFFSKEQDVVPPDDMMDSTVSFNLVKDEPIHHSGDKDGAQLSQILHKS